MHSYADAHSGPRLLPLLIFWAKRHDLGVFLQPQRLSSAARGFLRIRWNDLLAAFSPKSGGLCGNVTSQSRKKCSESCHRRHL